VSLEIDWKEIKRKGYVNLPRAIMDDPVFKNPHRFKFFLWCFMKCNHKDKYVPMGNQTVLVKRGSFIFGRKKAAEELDMNESTARNHLDFLTAQRGFRYRKLQENFTKLDIKTTNKYSIVTMRYYEEIAKLWTTKGQQKDTTNNVDTFKQQDTSLREEDKDKVQDSLSPDDIRRQIKKGESTLRSAKQKKEPNQLFIDAITYGIEQLKEKLKEKEAK